MEADGRSRRLVLLLALLRVCAALDCPRADNVFTDFTCSTDYNHSITCVWNSTRASGHTGSVCTVDATLTFPNRSERFSRRACTLRPVDASRPSLMSCSMDMEREAAFVHIEEWSINVRCNSSAQTLNMAFRPGCSIKLNPPGNPAVNLTTVSWTIPTQEDEGLQFFEYQLQWKDADRPWNDPSVMTVLKQSDTMCETELTPDQLFEGQSYEARVRVLVSHRELQSTWSDWSPTTSWVSAVGKAKRPGAFASAVDAWEMIGAGSGALAVVLFVVLIRTNASRVVNKLRGSPIPSPATSFLHKANFQNWLSPHFTSDSFPSFLQPEEILYVEVTCPVDAVAPFKPEAAFPDKARSESGSDLASSSFSNPSYSRLCSPPPFSSLSAGNLQPCAADAPYGPVASGDAEREQEDGGGTAPEILQLLSQGGQDKEPVQVISEYEKVDKVQVERTRLQSLDSGVCSGEEVSQDSLESDSITVTDSHDARPLDPEEPGHAEQDPEKLFRGTGGVFGKGSIQVSSGYERVQRTQADGSELPGLGEMSQDEADTAAGLLSAPCPPPSLTLLPPKLPELGPREDLQTLLHRMMEKKALVSGCRSVAPSADGYVSARQEQS